MEYTGNEKITVEEAAEFLECTALRVGELLREGVIPGIKLGKCWVILRFAFFESMNALAHVSASGIRDAAVIQAERVRRIAEMEPPRQRGRPRLPRSA